MNSSNQFQFLLRKLTVALFVFACTGLVWPSAGEDKKPAFSQRKFATPDDAIKDLLAAARAQDRGAMRDIFGPDYRQLLTGDEVQDKKHFESFASKIEESCKPEKDGDQITLAIGADNWPFPIPLVQHGDKWFFDTDAGKEEIINRHIGRDELNAIGVCREYVVAQGKYFSGNSSKYAQKFKSTPGKKDGLYWETGANEEASPFTALVSEAHAEGYGTNKNAGPHPFHGYIFRILNRQGRSAPGGRLDYMTADGMTRGFALVAYPVRWGNSGIMTFIVAQDGKVYQRNLGKSTARIAAAMKEYNPDSQWLPVEDKGVLEK